jgi:hypothetical protein
MTGIERLNTFGRRSMQRDALQCRQCGFNRVADERVDESVHIGRRSGLD